MAPVSSPPRSESRTAVLNGIRDMAPLMIAAFPFGGVIGLAISDAEAVPNLIGWMSAWLIFGGAAQLAAITLLAAGAGFFPAVGAALVVNLRHVMYSAALVPDFREQPVWFRRFGPYLLIDQVFALVSVKEADSDYWRRYYLGAGLFSWGLWQVAVAVGILVGPIVPESIELAFIVPALFIGLLVPTLRTRPAVLAAVVGVAVTVALSGVPNRGGMLIGGVAGVLAGAWADSRSNS